MLLENGLTAEAGSYIGGSPEVDIKYFKKNGFCRIKGLIPSQMIEHFKSIIAKTENGTTFDTIKKNTYNTAIDDHAVKSMIRHDTFAAMIGSLGYSDSIFTDGVIFETDAELGGFDWHLDITSFKYIYPTDKAFSIWVSLDPIDPTDQDGGLTLLSTASFSGREFFNLQATVTRSLIEGHYKIPALYKTLLGPKYRNDEEKKFKKLFPYIQNKFPHLFSDSIYISGFTRNLFESEGVSFPLAPGDAIIFDKNVFHRSNALLPGAMKTRRAFVLRFIEARSRFAAINASKAGGDDALLVERITRGRSEGDRFDLTNAVVIKVPE
jgi:hypothetical protein